MKKIGILGYPTKIDKLLYSLLGQTINIDTFFRYKARKLLELFSWTMVVGTVEGTRSTSLALNDLGGLMTNGTCSQRPSR